MSVALTIACTHCQRLLRLPPENLGQSVQCPACGRIQVAGAEPASSPGPYALLPLPPEPPSQTPTEIAAALPSPAFEPAPAVIPLSVKCPYCEGWLPLSASQCPACARAVDDATLERDISRLDERRRLLNILSFVFGLPGIYLLFVAEVYICTYLREPGRFDIVMATAMPTLFPWSVHWQVNLLLTLGLGLGLVGVGVALAAKYKGHSAAYGLLVALCFLGFFILPMLVRDRDGSKLERLRRTLWRRAMHGQDPAP
jgi:hypothetical protein